MMMYMMRQNRKKLNLSKSIHHQQNKLKKQFHILKKAAPFHVHLLPAMICRMIIKSTTIMLMRITAVPVSVTVTE